MYWNLFINTSLCNESIQEIFIIVKQWVVKHVYVQLYCIWAIVWVTAWIQLAALLKISNLSLVPNASKYREDIVFKAHPHKNEPNRLTLFLQKLTLYYKVIKFNSKDRIWTDILTILLQYCIRNVYSFAGYW